MNYFDRYKRRVNINGSTPQEKVLNEQIENYNNYILYAPNKKEAYIDKHINKDKYNITVQDVTINNTSGDEKYITTSNEAPAKVGSYVEWISDSPYILTEEDNNGVPSHKTFKSRPCNFILKWMDEYNNIIERCCIINDKTLYSDGEDSTRFMLEGGTDSSITLPIDSDTLKLKTGNRFILGNNVEQRKAYRITKTNDFSKGLLNVYLVEDKKQIPYDDIDNSIANRWGRPNYTLSILNQLPLKLTQGLTLQLNHEVKIDGEISNLEVIYEADNTNISIDSNGLITGNIIGITNIKVSLKDNPNINTTIPIEIASLPATDNYSVFISGSNSIIYKDTETYTATVNNNGLFTSNTVIWSLTGDTSKVEIVNQDGLSIKLKALSSTGNIVLKATIDSRSEFEEINIKLANLW